MSVKYPKIKVRLSGQDGNAFMIVGRVRSALRDNKVDPKQIEEFTTEAMSGDYSHVIATAGEWVRVS